jgi:hypothetical protein
MDLQTDLQAEAHLAKEHGLERKLNIERVHIPRAAREIPPVFRTDGKY